MIEMNKEAAMPAEIEMEAVALAAETEMEAEPEKAYTFRKLSSDDLFLMMRIIGAIGINDFKKCFESGNVLAVVQGMTDDEKKNGSGVLAASMAVALEIADVIFRNIGKCKNDVYQLLANTSNLTVEEITAEGNAILFMEMVIDFIRKDEFPAFIKVVSKFFK